MFDANLVIVWQLRDVIIWRQCIDPSNMCTPRVRFFGFRTRIRKSVVVAHIKHRCGFVANCCGKGDVTASGFLTLINLLKPTGYVMHQQFNIQQLYVLPTLYLCVLYLSENKQRLVALTAQTDWFL